VSLLGPKQAQFVSTLAAETGLNPRVIGSWAVAEQSGSAARNYEGKRYFNFLNIARTDSGDAGGAHSGVWADPVTAAKATAEWLKGQGRIAHEYGKPAGGIMAILRTAGASPNAQISAIANSGWASSGYNGGSTLRQLYGQLGGEKLPVTLGPGARDAAHALGAGAIAGEIAPHLPETAGPNEAQSADLVAALQATLSSGPSAPAVTAPARPQSAGGAEQPAGTPRVPQAPQQPAQKDPTAVLSLLSKLASEASPLSSAQQPSGEPVHHMAAYEEAGGASGHYVNPLPGFTKGRTDQGVDYSGKPGMPIRAIGDGVVLPGQADWFEGQPYVQYKLTSGPQRGKVVYVAEQITPQVKPGQRIRAGQRIGVYAPSGTALETGYGSGRPGVVASPYNGRPDGTETSGGIAARHFLERLGAR
jgi:murein DD-endopeptidase MepM/ murein hydrolase activator NlpD